MPMSGLQNSIIEERFFRFLLLSFQRQSNRPKSQKVKIFGFRAFTFESQKFQIYGEQWVDNVYPAELWCSGSHPFPVSPGILPHSLPEWAFRARPGLWRICLCPKVARIAEQKFGSR